MRYDAEPQSSNLWRNVWKWTTAFALFLALSAMLASLTLFQMTSEGAAKKTLRRSVAALTEIDPLIDRQYDDLQQRATASAPGSTLQLTDFPIDVLISRDQALASSKPQLRELLLSRSADVMYSNGSGVLLSSASSKSGVGRFSAAGITEHGLGFLRRRNHDILGVLTFVLAAISAALAVTLAVLCRGFGRLGSVGGVVLMAAMPLFAIGIGARFYMRIAADDNTEFIQREFLEIGQALAWVPIRNGAAFSVLGGVFVLLGIGCAIWADRRETPRYATSAASDASIR